MLNSTTLSAEQEKTIIRHFLKQDGLFHQFSELNASGLLSLEDSNNVRESIIAAVEKEVKSIAANASPRLVASMNDAPKIGELQPLDFKNSCEVVGKGEERTK